MHFPEHDCAALGICDSPSRVYGVDPAIRPFPVRQQRHAIAARNPVVVVTEDDLTNITLPRFISRRPNSLVRFEAIVTFASSRLEVGTASVGSRRSVSPGRNATSAVVEPAVSLRMQIPLGYFLPAKIVSNEKEFAIVFVVKEWWRNNQAVVECFATEPVAVGRNARFIHQDAESSNLLGTLAEYVRS